VEATFNESFNLLHSLIHTDFLFCGGVIRGREHRPILESGRAEHGVSD